jgi:hypothetical protein
MEIALEEQSHNADLDIAAPFSASAREACKE